MIRARLATLIGLSLVAILAIVTWWTLSQTSESLSTPPLTTTTSANVSPAVALPSNSTSSPPSKPVVAKVAWQIELPFGTHCSPRPFFGNEDPEILISFGDEFKETGGVVAVDARDGEIRWRTATENEMFALPVPLSQHPSGELPWVFGGRNGQLYAIDAVSGERLWKFTPSGDAGRADGVYNFFTGHPIGDVDDDGIDDYLVANGGDSKKEPRAPRPPGHLMVLSGADGSEIHRIEVPEKRETYCSPLLWAAKEEQWVVFGTGGETHPGSLWVVPLESVRAGSLKRIRRLVYNQGAKGSVAPPSFADLDGDGVDELIATPFDGRLVVVSGATMKELWKFSPVGTNETQSSVAIGDFDGDEDLDLFHVVQEGTFPQWSRSILYAFDGLSGKPLWKHTTDGDLAAASPLAVDVDEDGTDEVLLSTGDPAIFRSADALVESAVHVIHVDEHRIETVAKVSGFNPGASWVGDIDRDGKLEWFIPLRVGDRKGSLIRLDLESATPDHIAWGGYLGTEHDGHYSATP